MVAAILAGVIFVAMFGLIILDKIERHYVTLGCGALILILVFGLCMHSGTAVVETLNLHSFITPEFWYQAGRRPAPPAASTGRPFSLWPV